MGDAARIIGFIEAVTPGGVIGWAVQPGSVEPLRLRLRIDGEAVDLPFVCDGVRLDVWEARADLAPLCGHGPRLGFAVPLPPRCFDDTEHTFDIVTIDGEAAGLLRIGEPPGAAGVFRFPRLEVVGRARVGSTGGPRGGPAVQGWVFVRDRMTGETRVRNAIALEAGNGWRGAAMADRPRPDVQREMGCDPQCGFDCPVPAEALEAGGGVLRVSVLPEGLSFAEEMAIEPVLSADDDGRLWIGSVARSAVFGIAGALAALREGLDEGGPAEGGEVYASDPEKTVSTAFDRRFYLETYRDVWARGMDPVLHYVRTGWREGRRPTAWFDTEGYLTANPDVRDAGVNPFWHFLAVGRREGRVALREGGWRREAIDALGPERAVPGGAMLRLRPGYLAARLRAGAGAGLVVAVSGAGGAPFPAAEQRRFAGRGWGYLLMVPAAGGFGLVLDGEVLGVAEPVEVMGALAGEAAGPRLMAVHGLVGHDVGWLALLRRAAGIERGFVWLHDFSTLCAGGALLRNGVAFCGAPREGSDACLVCVHGESRPGHLADVARLLEGGGFTVVAPSARAAEMWRRIGGHGAAPLMEMTPYRLDERAVRLEPVAPGALGTRTNPLRVAFAGGNWEGFRAVLDQAGRLMCYRFYRLPEGQVMPEDRWRTDELVGEGPLEGRLAASGIDLLVVLPLGFEPFSTLTLAGMAAGADVVTLAVAGHAAGLVMAHGRGIVADDIGALCGFFSSLRAVAYVRERAVRGRRGGVVSVVETTAEALR